MSIVDITLLEILNFSKVVTNDGISIGHFHESFPYFQCAIFDSVIQSRLLPDDASYENDSGNRDGNGEYNIQSVIIFGNAPEKSWSSTVGVFRYKVVINLKIKNMPDRTSLTYTKEHEMVLPP